MYSDNGSLLILPGHPYPVLLAICVSLLVFSEASSFYLGSAGFKIAASLSFLGAGIHALTVKSVFPTILDMVHDIPKSDVFVVIGLACSLVGDVLLIPSLEEYHRQSSPRTSKREGQSSRFKAGTLAFTLAHIAYIIAFISDTTQQIFRWTDFILALSFGAILIYWLGILRNSPGTKIWFDVPKDMEYLVAVYITIILTMGATATATDAGIQRIVGAWTFIISDMFVAADVFGVKKSLQKEHSRRSGWKPRAVGWVAYFGAQLVLAGSIQQSEDH